MFSLASLKEKVLREIQRAMSNHRYEVNDKGILLPEQKLQLSGVYDHEVFRLPRHLRDIVASLGRIPEDLAQQFRDMGFSLGHAFDGNRIVTEGLNYLLDTGLHGSAQITTWYLAPFSGNVTPQATWTGATFTASATELTTYAETTRVALNEGAAAAGTTDNLSNKAVFTLNANSDIYGFGLSSAAAKSAITGTLLSAGRLAAPRTGLVATDVLNLGYAVQASSS